MSNDYLEDRTISWGAIRLLAGLLRLHSENKDPLCIEEIYRFIGGDDTESTTDEYLRELIFSGYIQTGDFYIGDGQHETRITRVLSSKEVG